MRAEISYDLVLDEDMGFLEGTYRLPGGDWQVVIVPPPHKTVAGSSVEPAEWHSGVTGMIVRLAHGERVNAFAVERALGAALGVSVWVRVRGPDSIVLR
jgi:hypothetical protein